MLIDSIQQKRKPIYLMCYKSEAEETKEWETYKTASKALSDNGYRTIVHQVAGTRFYYVFCAKSEWEKANTIVKEFGVTLSKEPESVFSRKIITGRYFF